jgi:hypothetical protein
VGGEDGMSDKYEIAVLAEDYETKRMIWQAHAIMNTPTDPDQRIASAIAYHLAEAEMISAWQRLEQAKFRLDEQARMG